MASVLVPLAEGCEELEAVTIMDLLVRGGVRVVSAGLKAGPVRCSRGTVLVPECTLDEALQQDFDMVVLPGGLPGADHLDQDPRIRQLLQDMHDEGKYTAAICAAPKVLANAGLLTDTTFTAYPGISDQLKVEGLRDSGEAVVRDGLIITSRGPGTAMDFALELITLLQGQETRQQVEAGLVR